MWDNKGLDLPQELLKKLLRTQSPPVATVLLRTTPESKGILLAWTLLGSGVATQALRPAHERVQSRKGPQLEWITPALRISGINMDRAKAGGAILPFKPR